MSECYKKVKDEYNNNKRAPTYEKRLKRTTKVVNPQCVIKRRLISCRPQASVHVSTGQCTCFYWPVETRPLASGRQLIDDFQMV